MSSKKNHRLPVLLTIDEWNTLQRIAARDSREAGPQLKWLLNEYAAGRLVSAAQMDVQRLEVTVQQMWREMQARLESIASLSASLSKTVSAKSSSPVQEPRVEVESSAQVTETQLVESAFDKPRSKAPRPK